MYGFFYLTSQFQRMYFVLFYLLRVLFIYVCACDCCLQLNHVILHFIIIIFFTLLSLDLASIFLSIPSSPSFLMNDSDVFLPEASGKTCPRSICHLKGELVAENFKAFVQRCFCPRIYVFVQKFSFSLCKCLKSEPQQLVQLTDLGCGDPLLFNACYVYRSCESRRPLQLRRRNSGSPHLPWRRASNPKMPHRSPRPHPLPGTRQTTLSKHSSPHRRGPRARLSPCRVSRLTPSKARPPPPPVLRRAWMPSPPCPGRRASGSPSVITLLLPAARAPGQRRSRGLRPAQEGRVGSSQMTLRAPPAEQQAAQRTAPPVSPMSSLVFQTEQWQLCNQVKY